MVVLYALYFSVRTVGVHNGLGTSAYDFGLYDQGIWLMSRGHSPFVTLMGRNLFGDHSSFILVLLIPLYWIHPCSPDSLVLDLFFNSVAVCRSVDRCGDRRASGVLVFATEIEK